MIVKICGITRLDDALAAAEEGASAVGFIFARSSPRFVGPDEAGEIIRRLPPFVSPVGVFVNEERAHVMSALARSGIRCIQFHGDETPEETAGYPVPVIKAFTVGDRFDPGIIMSYPGPAWLLDASVPGMRGGTGNTFDWSVARDASQYGRIILGGGITPGNALSAIHAARPYALDVSSGVETSPGLKDRTKIRSLMAECRKA
jgi:phosphoribosylanthranilate isomerase